MTDTKRILAVEDDTRWQAPKRHQNGSTLWGRKTARVADDPASDELVAGYGVGRPEPIAEMAGSSAVRALVGES